MMEDKIVPDFSIKPYEAYCGDAQGVLRQLRVGGIQFDCVVTSPPYYRQRKYGDDPREIGQVGFIDEYVASLVDVFKEIPLRPWASVWVNIGDKRGSKKELLGVPERFVTAMRDAGFVLMDKVVWAKEVTTVEGKSIGHCMVEPVSGRLNGNGWEPLYRFVVDSDKAWSDTCAVMIPRDDKHFFYEGTNDPIEQHPYSPNMACVTSIEGRNIPNAWYVGNSRHGRGHFAAYPPELIERPVAMTCPEFLVDDGGETKPRVRIVEQTVYSEGEGKSKRVFGQYSLSKEHRADESTFTDEERASMGSQRGKAGRMDYARHYVPKYPKTVGWTHIDKPVVGPGIVLDPFSGTGTTGEVTVLLGRRFVGIDLYEAAVKRMAERCEGALELRRCEG